jgi:hypothetical protein
MVEPPVPKVDVFPLMMIAEPVAGKVKVVPDTTTDPPCVRVVPGATTKEVFEPDTPAVIVCPLTVNTGSGVIAGLEDPKDEVCPFTMTAEPDTGKLNVVPDTVTTPPGVRVWLGENTKAVDEPAILAVMVWPSSVSIGCPVGLDLKVCVAPFTTAIEPPDAMLNVVPPTVTAGPPGVSDTPGATEKTPEGFAVIVF